MALTIGRLASTRFFSFFLVGLAATLPGMGCHSQDDSPAAAAATVSDLRARFPALPPAHVNGYRAAPEGWLPSLGESAGTKSARIVLPARSTAATHLEDVASGDSVDVVLRDARDAAGQAADGYVVYRNAHASGATLLHRAFPGGVEDFVSLKDRLRQPELVYQVTVGKKASGLRLVANTLEVLDATGTPRLRVEPPYVVGADGVRTDAALAVDGCAVDTNPAAPWGRAVTLPGADSCAVRVSWNDANVVYPAMVDPRWTTTGSMTTPRQDHTTTVLANGKVLVAGGRNTPTGTGGLATAELFDRTTGTWATTGSMTGGRWMHAATQLGTSGNATTSGKVLVTGGINGTASQVSAQLYSPAAGTWMAAADLNAPRHGHSGTLLANGNLLVAGGLNGTTVLNTAAVYNPTNGTGGIGTWAAVGNMASARRFHSATLLSVPSNATLNGKVMVVGGNSAGTTSLTSVQIFDGASAWTNGTALPSAREGHTATTLANNNVLVTGGRGGTTTLATTLVFNPASGTGTWTSAGTLVTARQAHTATLIASVIAGGGQVVVAGGSSGSAALASAELWNASNNTWAATTALPAAVQGHTASLLSNGTVLVAGGLNGSTTQSASPMFDVSFASTCSSGAQCATGFCVNNVCCDTACTGTCSACNLSGKVGTCSALAAGTTCRTATGVCDVAETCNGTALTCPADGFAPATTSCRTSTGVCDPAETCTGTSTTCPADAKRPNGFVCPDDGNICTVDICNGTSAACQHPAGNAGATCRNLQPRQCDAPETCTGTSTACPPDANAPNGAACDDFNACTLGDTCQSGACTPGAPLVCSPGGQCLLDGTCDPGTGICIYPWKPNGTPCGDGNACTQTDTCQTGLCTGGNPVTCPTPDECHTTGTCDSASGVCSNPLIHDMPCGASNGDILGFEDPGRWAVSSGTTSSVQQRTQGNAALAIASPVNYTTMVSDVLTSVGPELFGITEPTSFLVDMFLPTQQQNPDWFGSLDMFVTSVSRGVYNQYLGHQELTGKPLGAFSTYEFAFPTFVIQQLNQGPFSDLRVTIALNVPFQGTGTYVFDNLRLKGPVKPVVECVTALPDGTYRVLFGYENTSPSDYHQPIGPGNRVSPAPEDQGQPTLFNPGIHSKVFSADFTGASVTWELRGQTATATPSTSTPPCDVLPPTLTPIVECVQPLGNGLKRAYFGYENGTGAEVQIPISAENAVIPPPLQADRGQGTKFKTGSHHFTFSADFSNNAIEWRLAGAKATASEASSPACPPAPAVQPILEGIQHLDGNRFKAFFGYQNDTGATVEIPVGAYNKFTPGVPNGAPGSAGQATTFLPGRHFVEFAVESNGEDLVWQLGNSQQTATAQTGLLGDQFSDIASSVPTRIDICHEIIHRIFVPAKFEDLPDCKSTSWKFCLLQPDCCLPKPLCLANPICISVRLVQTIAAYWREQLDFTCEFTNWKDELAKFIVGLVPLQNVVIDAVLAYIEVAKTVADPVPGPVRDILFDLIGEEIFNGTQNTIGFTPLDIELTSIISGDDAAGAIFEMFVDQATNHGVTLDTLVVMTVRAEYDAIFDASGYVTPAEFRAGLGSGMLHLAINTLAHELVHIRQYRNAGPTAFVDQYLAEIILHSYGGSELEDQAFSYENTISMRH